MEWCLTIYSVTLIYRLTHIFGVTELKNMTNILSQRTYTLKEKMWFNSFAENLPLIRCEPNVNDLKKEVKPAIVIGAGPSLNKETMFKQLKKHEDSLRIFCSDIMLKPLLQAGIEPDIVGSLDGSQQISKFYEDVPHNNKTKACLTTYIHPDVTKTCLFDRYWFNIIFDDPQGSEVSLSRAMFWMTKKVILTNGFGNIGAWLTSLANELMSTPIILLGIDMSYGLETSPMKTSYWQHFIEQYGGNKKLILKKCYEYVSNGFGERVLTDIYFKSYAYTLMEGFKAMKSEILNCSRYSILKDNNIKCMSLEEALKKC